MDAPIARINHVTNLCTQDGQQLVVLAASLGHRDIFHALAVTDPSCVETHNEETGAGPLTAASASGYDDIVGDILLMRRARIDAADKSGRTALAHAAANGRVAVVRLLVSAGANVNCRDYHRMTPLMLAAAEDQHAVIDLLVETPGMQLEAVDDGGRTALIWACSCGHAAAAEALLVARCRANTRDAEGKTALMAAVSGGYVSIVSMLILSKADLDVTDGHGSTALALASAMGQTEIIDLLLGQGADCTTRDDDGRTALMQARLC